MNQIDLTMSEQPLSSASGTQPWWVDKRRHLLELCPADEAAYVYNLGQVGENISKLASMENIDRIFYAMKANNYPEVLRRVHDLGAGIECVSLGEIAKAEESIRDLRPCDILFTPNFAPRSEYEAAIQRGVHLTIDSLYPLQSWPEIFEGQKIILRINPDIEAGHHNHVQTAGPGAKFGLPVNQFRTAIELAQAAGAEVIGLHAHAGSGIHDSAYWPRLGAFLANLATPTPSIKFLNLGGGLAVDHPSRRTGIDFPKLKEGLARLGRHYQQFEFWMEPGRFIVANAGVLLARVTQIKKTGDANFVGVNTGMNSFIRAPLYGARHEIINLSRWGQPTEIHADVVGPICESADCFGRDIALPRTREGDIILIANTGAYGHVMASNYNDRKAAFEMTMA